jgi:hypothetical protein
MDAQFFGHPGAVGLNRPNCPAISTGIVFAFVVIVYAVEGV